VEILRETKGRVRVGEDLRGGWMARGERQGCILMADLEEEMGRIKWGDEVRSEESIFISLRG